MTVKQNDILSVTIKDACLLIGIGRSKMYELFQDGRLTPIKVGKRTLVSYAELKRLVTPAQPEREVVPLEELLK